MIEVWILVFLLLILIFVCLEIVKLQRDLKNLLIERNWYIERIMELREEIEEYNNPKKDYLWGECTQVD